MDRIERLLRAAYYLFRDALDSELRELGLTSAQSGVLMSVEEREGASVAQLARYCLVTPQRMHTIVVGLEETGLVAREPHPDLERVLCTRLTAAGRAALARCRRHADDVAERMLAGIDMPTREQTAELLTTMVGNLQRATR